MRHRFLIDESSETVHQAIFRLKDVEAVAVSLVGDFNNWSTTAHPMTWNGKWWEIMLNLPVGKYAYAYFALDVGDDVGLCASLLNDGFSVEIVGTPPVFESQNV
jgi:1,4-alpha-glucan branching enzyme